MIQKLLRKELIGKTVTTEAGSILGVLDEIVVDTETGELKYLLLRGTIQTKPGQKIDAKGRSIYAMTSMSVGETTITVK